MMMQRRPEFSFPGSPARGHQSRALPPRPPSNTVVAPRPSEEEEVRWLQASRQGSPDYASSGTPSPPLWSHHNHDHRDRLYPASAGSSPSRAQAIAGYRREMLDLVRGLPESAYELSLRDIVERPSPSSSSSPPPPSSAPLPTPPLPPPPPTPPAAPSSNATDAVAPTRGHEPAASADEQAAKQQSGAKTTKQGRKQQQRAAAAPRRQRSRSLERSVSLDTGLLIKFFMPLSIGGCRGKKKVSPKPDAKRKKKKQGAKEEARDEEWWRKSEFSEAGSSSRTSSTGSSNDSIRNGAGAGKSDGGGGGNPRAPVRSRSRKRNGCYGFFRTHKSKNDVTQD